MTQFKDDMSNDNSEYVLILVENLAITGTVMADMWDAQMMERPEYITVPRPAWFEIHRMHLYAYDPTTKSVWDTETMSDPTPDDGEALQ